MLLLISQKITRKLRLISRTFSTRIIWRIPSANLRILASSWVSRTLKLLMLGMFATLLIVACNSNAPERITSGDTANSMLSSNASNCRIVKHDMGETQVCGQPQKIVALSPHLLDLLLSLNRQPAGYA